MQFSVTVGEYYQALCIIRLEASKKKCNSLCKKIAKTVVPYILQQKNLNIYKANRIVYPLPGLNNFLVFLLFLFCLYYCLHCIIFYSFFRQNLHTLKCTNVTHTLLRYKICPSSQKVPWSLNHPNSCQRLILSVLELQVSVIIQCSYLHWFISCSVMFLRFIYVVVYFSGLFLFIVE